MANELNNKIKLLLNENTIKKNNKIISAGNNIMTTKNNTDEVRKMMGLNGGQLTKFIDNEIVKQGGNREYGRKFIMSILPKVIQYLIGSGMVGGVMNDVVEDEEQDFDDTMEGGSLFGTIGSLVDSITGMGKTQFAGHDIDFINDMGNQRAFTLKSLPKANGVKDGVRKGGNLKNPETRQSTIRMGGNKLPYMEYSNANVTGNVEYVEPAGRQRGNVYGMKSKRVGGMRRGGADPAGDPADDPLPPVPARAFDRVKNKTMKADEIRKRRLQERMARLMELDFQASQMEQIGDVGDEYNQIIDEINRLRQVLRTVPPRRKGGALDTDIVLAEQQAQGAGLFGNIGNLVGSLTGLGKNKKLPKGYHLMPDGTVMKDSDHKGGSLFGSIGSLIDGLAGTGKTKKPRKQTPAMKKGTEALMEYQAKLKKLKSQGMSHKEAQQTLREMKG